MIYNISVITITITMSIILANFDKYAISDCPFIKLFEVTIRTEVIFRANKTNIFVRRTEVNFRANNLINGFVHTEVQLPCELTV